MTDTLTPAKLKALIKAGQKHKNQTPRLYVAEDLDGTLYATDSHWLVPVAKVAGLLSAYNLDAKAGTYEVAGTVTYRDDNTPNVASLLSDHETANKVVLVPHLVSGLQSYVKVGDKFCAMFERPGGSLVGIDSTYLDFVAPDWRNTSPHHPVVLAQQADDDVSKGELKAIGVYVRTEKSYTAANPYRTVRTYDTTVSLIMPVRIS